LALFDAILLRKVARLPLDDFYSTQRSCPTSITIIKDASCRLLFDDYFRTNAADHDHFTRSQSGFHAISYKTKIAGFTVTAEPKL